jgi:hypothetical protein
MGVFQVYDIKFIGQRIVSQFHIQSPDPMSTFHVVSICYYYVKSLIVLCWNVSFGDKCWVNEIMSGPTIN